MGVVANAHAEVSRVKDEATLGRRERLLAGAVCAIVGAVERYMSGLRSIPLVR